MYRLKGADEAFRQKTLERIRSVSAYQQQLIDEYSEVPNFYNQWAWLIANTEGDQAKAVEYSRRSLELAPDEASYLDTLGRCYFAVGDLENAAKSQRQAVKLAPQYHVMQKQLALFESALAAKPSK
jgi:Flp pilus assembly protein TadD